MSGFLGAIGLATIVGAFLFTSMSFLFSQAVHHSWTPSSKGKIGRVVLAIPGNGIGQVAIKIQQEYQIYRARSLQGIDIPAQTTVEVVAEDRNSRLVTVKEKN